MKKLPKEKRMRGFDYELLKRAAAVALYSLSVGGSVYGYEVHKVRISAPHTAKYKQSDGTIKIVDYPKQERLASTNEFGTYGWGYQFKNDALKKFKEVKNGK